MGKYDGILLCSDFDGTLYYKGSITRENCDAIAYFQSEGGLFAPASGRYPGFFHKHAGFFRPNAPVIALNGAVIAEYRSDDPGDDRILYEGNLDREKAIALARKMLEDPGTYQVDFFAMNDIYEFHAEDPDCCLRMDSLPAHMHKMILRVRAEESDRLIQKAIGLGSRDFNLGRSWVRGIECLSKPDEKGTAARRVKELVGAETLVCVGDYENDISMLRAADIGYAVGNAVNSLKEVADRVTVPCAENAIAKIISEL